MLPLQGGRLSKPLPSTTRPTLQLKIHYNKFLVVCQPLLARLVGFEPTYEGLEDPCPSLGPQPCKTWSGIRESNPHQKIGNLLFCH